MKITLCPVAANKTTLVAVNGDVITVGGIDYDLSTIPDNSQVEAELPAIGVVKRVDGVIEITVKYHYDEVLAEPMQSTDINDYIVDVTSGEVPSPIVWLPQLAIDESTE